ncbi:MAG: zinc ribbon domain-containing protein [Planctomycetota bacterium]
MSKPDEDWFACPNCGEEVPTNALSCPACGSDDETGWSEEAAYDDLDLPAYADDEQPAGAGRGWRGVYAWVVAPLIIVFLLWALL